MGRLAHANLGRQFPIVEDAGQAVVESHGKERARAASAVFCDAVLIELGDRPLIPAKSCGVVVKVHEQPLSGKRDHGRQPDKVRRIVAREQPRRRVDEVRELVLADVPSDVRVLVRELLRRGKRGFHSAG